MLLVDCANRAEIVLDVVVEDVADGSGKSCLGCLRIILLALVSLVFFGELVSLSCLLASRSLDNSKQLLIYIL